MNEGAAFRGQPLLLLGGLLIGWTAFRVALWQAPVADQVPALLPDEAAPVGFVHAVDPVAVEEPLAWLPPGRSAAAIRANWTAPKSQMAQPKPLLVRQALMPPTDVQVPIARQYITPGIPAAAPALAAFIGPSQPRTPRWSADGWLLLRDDTVTPLLSGRPSYGRSQAGAIVRYGLAPASSHRPQAYLRASSALSGDREREVALGLSARPLGAAPVRVAIEGRLGETDRGTRTRPAVYAVTELPTFRLPAGMHAEIYAEAGYVGGAFATPFVDGQAHVGRPLASLAGIELSVGAGAWGGAQDDASRLDVGPTAIVSFRLGKGFARIAADYRFRAAGNAEPQSGPALTVSAGF